MGNVLFSSVGRRVELLRIFQSAFRALGLDGKIIATDIDPLAPGFQVADVSYLVPRLDDPGYIPALVRVCQKEDVTLVFPLIDPEIPILAGGRAALEAVGARLAVVSPSAAEMTADKWLTHQFFQKLGLPAPQTWLPGTLHADEASYPLFIKPRRGSAAKNTFKVTTPDELAFFSRYVPEPLIQEYLPGHEITCDVVADLDGALLAVVQRQRIEVRWGEVAKGVTIFDQALCDACASVARELPAIGPITLQGIMKDGRVLLTEINARLGGGIPLAVAAGADIARWLLARNAGIATDIPPLGSYQVGLNMTRFDDSFFLDGEHLGQVASRHS